MSAQWASIFASTKQKTLKNTGIMNTDNTLSIISSMLVSETSYMTLVEMINDMDLELMDISLS